MEHTDIAVSLQLSVGIAASLQHQAQPSATHAASAAGYSQPAHMQQHSTASSSQLPMALQSTSTNVSASCPACSSATAHSAQRGANSWTSLGKPDGFVQITIGDSPPADQELRLLQAPVVTGLSPRPTSVASDCIQAAHTHRAWHADSHQLTQASRFMSAQQPAPEAPECTPAACSWDVQDDAGCYQLPQSSTVVPVQQPADGHQTMAPVATAVLADGNSSSEHAQAARPQHSNKHISKTSNRLDRIGFARSINPFSLRSQRQCKHQAHSTVSHTLPNIATSRHGSPFLADDSLAGFLHQQSKAGQWPPGHLQHAHIPEAYAQTSMLPAAVASGFQPALPLSRAYHMNQHVTDPASQSPGATSITLPNLPGTSFVATMQPVPDGSQPSGTPQQQSCTSASRMQSDPTHDSGTAPSASSARAESTNNGSSSQAGIRHCRLLYYCSAVLTSMRVAAVLLAHHIVALHHLMLQVSAVQALCHENSW